MYIILKIQEECYKRKKAKLLTKKSLIIASEEKSLDCKDYHILFLQFVLDCLLFQIALLFSVVGKLNIDKTIICPSAFLEVQNGKNI